MTKSRHHDSSRHAKTIGRSRTTAQTPARDPIGELIDRRGNAHTRARLGGLRKSGADSAAHVPAGDVDADVAAGPHPLGRYYMLWSALPREQMEGLEAAARAREAPTRQAASSPVQPIASVTVSLRQVLERTATRSRADILASDLDLLATDDGPTEQASQLALQIATNEALRKYLEDKLDRPVTISLLDPLGFMPWLPPTLAFTVDGVAIADQDGAIPVANLDPISNVPLAELCDREGLAADQLVEIAVADRVIRSSLEKADQLAAQTRAHPGDAVANDLRRTLAAFSSAKSKLQHLARDLEPENRDQAGRLPQLQAELAAGSERVRDALVFLNHWQHDLIPDQTAGEFWDEQQSDTRSDMSRHWHSASGWLLWDAARWGTNEIYEGCGNVVTGGGMSRAGRNAAAFRAGDISYNTYSDNTWWNFGESLVTDIVTALTAGWGTRLTMWGTGLGEGMLTTRAGMYLAGSAEGFVGGTTSAAGSDVYDGIAGIFSRRPDARSYHWNSMVGPLGWLRAGYGGMLLGGPLAGMGTPDALSFSRPRSLSGGFPGLEPAPDWLQDNALGGVDLIDAARPGFGEPLLDTGGAPRISPILDASGRPFGAPEYLEAGAPASRPVLYTELGGRIVPVGSTPAGTVLGPGGEVVVGAQPPSPAIELVSPQGEVVYSDAPGWTRPGTEIVPWGRSGWETVPGNATIVTRSGAEAQAWQFEEDQAADYADVGPAERQVNVPLSRQVVFSGRTMPQGSVTLDMARSDWTMVGEVKMRNWTSPRYGISNALDLAGSIERAYMACDIQARATPAANSAEILVVSSREIPVETNRLVYRAIADWMLGQGMSSSAVYDLISRLRFLHLPLQDPR